MIFSVLNWQVHGKNSRGKDASSCEDHFARKSYILLDIKMPFNTLKITPFLKHGQNMSPLVLSKRTVCKHRRKKKVKLIKE